MHVARINIYVRKKEPNHETNQAFCSSLLLQKMFFLIWRLKIEAFSSFRFIQRTLGRQILPSSKSRLYFFHCVSKFKDLYYGRIIGLESITIRSLMYTSDQLGVL